MGRLKHNVANLLLQITKTIRGFADWPHSEKIKFFAWFQHIHKENDRFAPSDIRRCYEDAGLEQPSNVSPYIAGLEKKKPKEVLRDRRGLYLPTPLKEAMNVKYGQREITVQITRLIADLPNTVPDLTERTFLDEAITCYRHGAFRASIVMAWNLAYHHLCQYVLKNKLTEFNTQWPLVYQGHHKKKLKQIVTMDDFTEELKESEVVEICNSAGVFTGAVYRILKEKLGKRNSAAHPSSVAVGQLQAEDFIDDLVKNVVVKLQ
jgi:hypothetical protein